MAKYRILSLDGGGIRGLLMAIVLERLQEKVPGWLGKVDLIAGTSTGGIIALCLANGVPISTVRDLYENRGRKIFADSLWDDVTDLFGLVGAEYSNKNLTRELKKILGDTLLKDLKKKVLIPAFNLDNKSLDEKKRCWKPKFFHNFKGKDTDEKEPAYKIALYTSAAPTYFPSVDGYIDGGVVANNPSMAAFAQTQDPRNKDSCPMTKDIVLLSLGTGKSTTCIKGKKHDWGYSQWAKPIINIMMDGLEKVPHYQCERVLGNSYHRLAPVFPPGKEFPLDGVKKIPELVEFAENIQLRHTLKWIKDYWV